MNEVVYTLAGLNHFTGCLPPCPLWATEILLSQEIQGGLFSMAVMFTGVFYLFIVLPFAFMEFLYKPFVEYQSGARVPKKYEATDQKHVILTHYDSISHALMEKLSQFGYPFVLVIDKLKEAQKYHDMGIPVMFGSMEDPETFESAGSKMPLCWWLLMMIFVM